MADNSINPDGVQIKPNVVSWRNINVSNAFYTSYDYKRNLDSHMMKNTEWGAVAYLQHSEYGSHRSVRMNNNSNFITGYAAVNEPTCGYTSDNRDCNRYGTTSDETLPYNTTTGYLASTTGNISGIYDMSGGAWEHVMGVMLNSAGNHPLSGYNSSQNSGFNGAFGSGGSLTTGLDFPETKFYDSYRYSDKSANFSGRILGDATGEIGPFQKVTYGSLTRLINSWYLDQGSAVYHIGVWYFRGGTFEAGSQAGMFAVASHQGHNEESISFRLVLAF